MCRARRPTQQLKISGKVQQVRINRSASIVDVPILVKRFDLGERVLGTKGGEGLQPSPSTTFYVAPREATYPVSVPTVNIAGMGTEVVTRQGTRYGLSAKPLRCRPDQKRTRYVAIYFRAWL